MTKFAVVFALLLVVIGLSLAGGKPAQATHVACGSTLIENTVLDADLTCPGTALTIGADGITLDLNGHTLTGPSVAPCTQCPGIDGVLLSGRRGVSIKNGTITGFVFGIRLDNSDDNLIQNVVVKNSNLNGISLFNDSDKNKLDGCTSANNAGGGAGFGIIMNSGSDGNRVQDCVVSGNKGAAGVFIGGGGGLPPSFENVVVHNTIIGNAGRGVFIQGGSERNVVKDNAIHQSTIDGVFINGSFNNEVKGNTSSSNARHGVALVQGSSNNLVKDNTITGNGQRGIFIGTATTPHPENNRFQDNQVTGNTSPDIRDGTTGQGTAGTRNFYKDNRCGSSNPAGLCVSP